MSLKLPAYRFTVNQASKRAPKKLEAIKAVSDNEMLCQREKISSTRKH
jgi:hypothetical protein